MRIGWKAAVHDPKIASFRYRVKQPAEALAALGHRVELFDASAAKAYDAIVFAKSYAAPDRELAKAAKAAGKRIVFDICDNHFYNPYDLPRYARARGEMLEMMALADRVICTTEALARVVSEETGGEIRPLVVGDAADRPGKLAEGRNGDASKPLKLLWFGSHGSPNAPSGMTDLSLIRGDLEALHAKAAIELTVCSNNREKFDAEIAGFAVPTRYVEWQAETFEDVLAAADRAVLPITVNPFTACKSNNRLTTALYAGLPTVATGIESYKEFSPFCTLDDWRGGLEALASDYQAARAKALAARGHIDRRWSMDSLAPQWEAALELPAAEPKPKPRKASKEDAPGPVQGRIDAICEGAVSGWARYPLRPDRPVEVVLESDGEVVATALADLARPDLQLTGITDAACGFRLSVAGLDLESSPNLRVRTADGAVVIGEHAIVVGKIDTELAASPAGLVERGSAPRPVVAARLPVEPAIAAQTALLQDIEAVTRHLIELRRVLARSVISLDAAPELASMLQGALGAGQSEP